MNDQSELTRNVNWLLREKYGGEITKEAGKDIARLKQGEPVDYVIGWVDFLGCRVDLSMRSFIPRPETEYWVGKAIEDINKFVFPFRSKMKSRKGVIRCLDVFAGSGCIGVALLSHLPDAVVDFAEQEEAPLKQIAINTALNKINPSRYRIIRSDMLSSLKASEHYDYIFANPPYIAEMRKADAQESVLTWEPHAALFAKDDGLSYIELLLKEAKHYLAKDGTMYIEFDTPQKPALSEMLARYGYANIRFCKDQYEKWRWAKIR